MRVKRHLFTELPRSDTCWDLSGSADGRIYIGACSEHTAGGIAELVQFDPATEKLRYVADMARVTGEKVGGTHAPQGKIHFSLCPSREGFIYGSTHCTTPPAMDTMWDPWAMHMDARRCFLGAHLYRYDPRSDETLDFGVVVPYEGVSLMTLEEEAGRFFAFSFPRSHLYSWDLKGRDAVDLGRVSEHYVIGLVRYDEQTIFFSDYYGRLLSIDPRKMEVRARGVQLPHPDYTDGMRNWLAHAVLGPDGWVYAGMYSYPNLIRFQPARQGIEVQDLGRGPAEEAGDPAAAYAFDSGSPVGLILAGRRLYYAQLVYLGPKECIGAYIASYDLAGGRQRYHGRLELDGFRPLVWKGTPGRGGTLYWADFDAAPPSLWGVEGEQL